MSAELLAALVDAGAGAVLLFGFVWIVTRCEVRIDCNDRRENEDE